MIAFREAEQKDLPSILELYKQLNPDDEELAIADAEKIWADVFMDRGLKYFIAVDLDKVISTCYICIIPNLTRMGRSIGFIENVVTDDAYRRQGIGGKVVKMAVDYARDQNCYKVVLQSGIERKYAHVFYESIGFNGSSKKAFEIRFE